MEVAMFGVLLGVKVMGSMPMILMEIPGLRLNPSRNSASISEQLLTKRDMKGEFSLLRPKTSYIIILSFTLQAMRVDGMSI